LAALLGLEQVEVLVDEELEIFVRHVQFRRVLNHAPEPFLVGRVELAMCSLPQEHPKTSATQATCLGGIEITADEEERSPAVAIPEDLVEPRVDHEHPRHDPLLPVRHRLAELPRLPSKAPERIERRSADDRLSKMGVDDRQT